MPQLHFTKIEAEKKEIEKHLKPEKVMIAMVEAFLTFLVRYKYILLFYLAVGIFLLLKRKSIEVQAKFILLYRRQWGIRLMDWFVSRYRQWVILWGYIGVGAGYVGLGLISLLLFKNLYDFFTVPEAVAGVSLVLPGLDVPGVGVLPFWYWVLALFVIAVVHEFSHGIVARAHGVTVKNTGLVFLGPIIGAFVEPNEKKLTKEKDIVQYSILAAGSFSNILTAMVAALLLNFVVLGALEGMQQPQGFTFKEYYGEEYPFSQAGIAPGTLIRGINGIETFTFEEFNEELQHYRPGDTITVATATSEHTVILAQNPDSPKKPFLGVKYLEPKLELKDKYHTSSGKLGYGFLSWIAGFLKWLSILSLGIGLFNLLALPIVDGGRMAQVFLHQLKGPIAGEKRYRQISLFFLALLLLNLLLPWVVGLV